jgi:hypothetical protein
MDNAVMWLLAPCIVLFLISSVAEWIDGRHMRKIIRECEARRLEKEKEAARREAHARFRKD